MINEDDEMKRASDNAASAEPPQPTRRQFLKGLTTAPSSDRRLDSVRLRPRHSAAQNSRRNRNDYGLPLLWCRLRPGRLYAQRARSSISRATPAIRLAKELCAAKERRASRW